MSYDAMILKRLNFTYNRQLFDNSVVMMHGKLF